MINTIIEHCSERRLIYRTINNGSIWKECNLLEDKDIILPGTSCLDIKTEDFCTNISDILSANYSALDALIIKDMICILKLGDTVDELEGKENFG